mmetsp:Transcript_1701/g.3498  ORF Transcript_1701/g.3498 Transcript_1701/m.3498 type:complete len:217 (+) Transcript_1701:618-1268(+)
MRVQTFLTVSLPNAQGGQGMRDGQGTREGQEGQSPAPPPGYRYNPSATVQLPVPTDPDASFVFSLPPGVGEGVGGSRVQVALEVLLSEGRRGGSKGAEGAEGWSASPSTPSSNSSTSTPTPWTALALAPLTLLLQDRLPSGHVQYSLNPLLGPKTLSLDTQVCYPPPPPLSFSSLSLHFSFLQFPLSSLLSLLSLLCYMLYVVCYILIHNMLLHVL